VIVVIPPIKAVATAIKPALLAPLSLTLPSSSVMYTPHSGILVFVETGFFGKVHVSANHPLLK
jgi:hypothetical protein